MQITETLPDIADLTNQNVVLSLTPDTTTPTAVESDPVITGFSASQEDSGIETSFDLDNMYIDGMYLDKFSQSMKWTKGQIDRNPDGTPIIDLLQNSYILNPLLPIIEETATGWNNVPPAPGETGYDLAELWFLSRFQPPDDTSDRSAVYTVTGTMTVTDTLIVPPTVTEDVPFTASVSQVVFYDEPTNTAHFKRYYPTGGTPQDINTTPPPMDGGLPYTLPYTILR